MLRISTVNVPRDLLRGHGAIADKVVRLRFFGLVYDRPRYFFRDVVKLSLHRIGTVVP